MQSNSLQFVEKVSKNKTKRLLIFLHGYGSNGQNLMDLSSHIGKIATDIHFISPNAPYKFEYDTTNSEGYQWFSLENRNLDSSKDEIIYSGNLLRDFISFHLKRLNLEYDDLILLGFSQGAMIGMYNAFRLEKNVKVISCSGRLILPTYLGESINSKPNICLIHGCNDDVVPFSNMIEAKETLNDLSVPHESHAIENLDHSIDYRAISHINKFIEK